MEITAHPLVEPDPNAQSAGKTVDWIASCRRRADLDVRNVDGETVILDRKGGRIHQLNPAASLVWQGIDSARSLDDIARELVGVYGISLTLARRDAARLMSQLHDYGLMSSCGDDTKELA